VSGFHSPRLVGAAVRATRPAQRHPPGRRGQLLRQGTTIAGVETRVLVVEPSLIIRQGIRAQLAADKTLIVAEVATGAEAIAAAALHRPDVVLLDFNLPDRQGSEVCRAILDRDPATAVIVLSAQSDEASVVPALSSGARAYLMKDADDLDLPRAIERILAGERVIDPQAAGVLVEAHDRGDGRRLSAQELNVVRLAAEGLTNPEIGTRLHLSRHTVKEYLSHAMRKLEAGNRIDAVRKATELGLIPAIGPAPTGEPRPAAETLVYNESGAPVVSSELKVPPLKIDKLERANPDT
jgi:DNA-binding NarL/FixJ family response regulator